MYVAYTDGYAWVSYIRDSYCIRDSYYIRQVLSAEHGTMRPVGCGRLQNATQQGRYERSGTGRKEIARYGGGYHGEHEVAEERVQAEPCQGRGDGPGQDDAQPMAAPRIEEEPDP